MEEKQKKTALPCSVKIRQLVKVCQARNNFKSYDETLAYLVMLDPKIKDIYDVQVMGRTTPLI